MTMTFFKKEMNEIIKTHKIYVLPALFLFFGFLSPLTAKFMPQLMEEMAKSTGMIIKYAQEQSFLDSYAQLFKNISQLAFIIILVFVGGIVGEKVKGTAALILTKPVSRTKFIISKFTAAIALYTFAYLLSVIACVYYTYLLFPVFYNDKLVLSLLMLWGSGAFMISATIFISTISKSFTTAAGLGIGAYLLLLASTAVPYVSKYTPGNIGNIGLSILQGTTPIEDATAPIMTATILAGLLIFGSIAVFKRQEI
jgi:ABC-2 type transport system permease protein